MGSRLVEHEANEHDAVLACPYLSKLLAESRGAGLTRTRGEAPFLSPRSRSGPILYPSRRSAAPKNPCGRLGIPYELQTKSD
jgi:hypothetical protein